jgi:hypothetical protein
MISLVLAVLLSLFVYEFNFWYFNSIFGSTSDVITSYDLLFNKSIDSIISIFSSSLNFYDIYNLYGGEPLYMIVRSLLNLDAIQFHSLLLAGLFVICFHINFKSVFIHQRIVSFSFIFPFFFGDLTGGNSRQLLFTILLIMVINYFSYFLSRPNEATIILFGLIFFIIGIFTHIPSMLVLICIMFLFTLKPQLISEGFEKYYTNKIRSVRIDFSFLKVRLSTVTVFSGTIIAAFALVLYLYFGDLVYSKLFYFSQGLSSYKLDFFTFCVLSPLVLLVLYAGNFKITFRTLTVTIFMFSAPFLIGSGFWRIIAQILIIFLCCPKMLQSQRIIHYRLIYQSIAFLSIPLAIVHSIIKYS